MFVSSMSPSLVESVEVMGGVAMPYFEQKRVILIQI